LTIGKKGVLTLYLKKIIPIVEVWPSKNYMANILIDRFASIFPFSKLEQSEIEESTLIIKLTN
jgi:hypothetical protein